MENASKALIIAGSILISILVVSLGVLIFNKFSSNAKQAANMDEQEIEEYNSKILPYIGDTISGSQVNALIQLVFSIDTSSINNQDAKRITLNYDGRKLCVNADETAVDRGVRRVETGPSQYYKVEIEEYNDFGLISEITVTKNDVSAP